MTSTQDVLRLLMDEREIISRINAYCSALDSRNFEGLRDVYTPDATALLVESEFGDLDAIIEKCRVALSPLDGSHHLVGNYEIQVDGDAATSHTYLQAQHIKAGVHGEPTFIMAGFYDDVWTRLEVGWRISRRILTITWTSGNAAVVSR
jgi:ketosteroid isomerase-like protein